MPNYIYTAKDKQGKTQNRHIETVNKHELAAILRSQELVLISAEVAGHEESGAKIIIFFKNLSKKWGWVSLVDKRLAQIKSKLQ